MTTSLYAESLQLARTLRATLNATAHDARLGNEMFRALASLPLEIAHAKNEAAYSDRRSGTSGARR